MSKRIYDERRPHVPQLLRRQALMEAGHKCSIPSCSENVELELHHINQNRNDNSLENVIILCCNHHRKAERDVIDRKSLREYKRINRKRNGFDIIFELASEDRDMYLNQFIRWNEKEILGIVSSPINSSGVDAFVAPTLNISTTTDLSATELLGQIDEFLGIHGKFMLLGNGGNGKTVTLLSWLRYKCLKALEDEAQAIPVYVALRHLTPNQSIHTLVRSSLGRFSININQQQLDEMLLSGQICLVLDGLNELNKRAEDNGAVQDIINFVYTYPSVKLIVSSRYTVLTDSISMQRVHMLGWERWKIREYLVNRLGESMGNQLFMKIGDDIDFEWMDGWSVIGLCSSPLTLWMLATVAEQEGDVTDNDDDIANRLVDVMVKRMREEVKAGIPSTLVVKLIEEFAYFMINEGYVVSVHKEVAITICARIIRDWRNKGLLPGFLDSYGLLSLLQATGLISEKNDGKVEWVHQVLQEKLSKNVSDRIFQNFIRLSELLMCPECGYLPKYYNNQDELWGKCESHEEHHYCVDFKVQLPDTPRKYVLKELVLVKDYTGAPLEDGKTSFPHAVYEEGWSRYLTIGILIYFMLLSVAQDKKSIQPIEREYFNIKPDELPARLFDHYIWLLCEARIIDVEHELGLSVVSLYSPPTNPSFRIASFELEVQREMSSGELEDDEEEERFAIFTEENIKLLEEHRSKGLSIRSAYRFPFEEKEKIFRVAKKHGGRIWRLWGPYREIIAEFSGDAWDLSTKLVNDNMTPDVL